VSEVVVELQRALRSELKEPMGEVFTDTEALLGAAGDPLVAVGDIVTYHLLQAGRTPEVALIDRRTERSAVDEEVEAAIGGFDRDVGVVNPPATLTDELLTALREAIDGAEALTGSRLIEVDGEEDLATLPAILAAPEGASVVYGQPGEGMVLVQVDGESTAHARDLLGRMAGDPSRVWALLDLEG
jgi:uncharacterized protein (UPF0218 family)